MSEETKKDSNTIFIPGNVPSSKNSRINTTRGSFHSKTVKNYLRGLGIQGYSSSKKIVTRYKTIACLMDQYMDKIKELTKDKPNPIVIEFHFVRNSRHKFDFHNAVQLILDLMTAYDVIEDDNMDCMIPIPKQRESLWYTHDKENPGVYITIL